MENDFPKNRPTRCAAVRVNRAQFDHIFTDAAVAKGDEIAKSLAALKDDIAPAADKRFVLFKNKFVWFDREVSGLFPRMEKKDLPIFRCNEGSAARAYSETREGFLFLPITYKEASITFAKNNGNPYMDFSGNMPLKYYHSSVNWPCEIITGDKLNCPHYGSSRDCNYWWRIRDNGRANPCTNCNGIISTLILIHRLRGKNAAAMNYPEAVLAWIANGLIPEGLNDKQERFYKTFMDDYPKIEEYISVDSGNIIFDGERFKRDVLSGEFKEKVFDYDFDIRGTLDGVISGQKKYTGSVAALKKELLDCDHKRANIQPYEDRQLTDVNRGHWELFEETLLDSSGDSAQVQLPKDEILVARPPQLDVRLNGICAIDFGTKSTIVVCRDGEARMLRIGQGDYSKAPTMRDFENPTVIELRDIQAFLAAYRARNGRPFTEWNQVTVSHQAADAIFKDNSLGSSVYNSVFNELKQWAKDEGNYPVLKDLRGEPQEIKPYLETKEIDAGDFDPIELYAYYLGLYINNMHHQIYLDYILSYPVNYKKEIREHIRKSFENGIKKSLPPALLRDEEMMKRFRVYLGASEPAAYAISALEGFNLEPKEFDKPVAYGVFDFGGGTTDFDFGIENVSENGRKCNFIIKQFGFNGDILLGGENMLELIAYEVYKDNIDVMREKKIPFALPVGCESIAGAETLIKSHTKDASAHMNNRILSEKLRPIWENTDERKDLTEAPLNVTLFSSEKQDKDSGSYSVSVNLNIDTEKLDTCIAERIREGVVNFFQSLHSAFKGKEVDKIHIFLAGNSCRSPIVKKLFDEFIEKEEGDFVLHMPLGMEDKTADDETADDKPAQIDFDLDKKRTGKTGVAFGLLRCRKGGKDVKIVNENIDDEGNPTFPYYLGDAGNDGNTFTVRIDKQVKYGEWTYFTVADEPEFELYYTTAPRALKNDMPVAQVSMVRCLLDEEDTTDDDDYGVYIKKVSPNQIEYAVGCDDDFKGEFSGKIHKQTL